MKLETLTAVLALMGLTTLGAHAATGADPDIQTHPSGTGYVLTLTSSAITNVPAAQAAMLSAAQKLCGVKIPQFGHYKFKATAPLGTSSSDKGAKIGLAVDQEIACVDSPPQATSPAPSDPNWHPSDADQKAIIDVITRYFAAKDSGDIAASYALLDDGMGLSLKEWKSSSDDLAAETGPVVSHKVTKLTWYKDPPDAPKRGVYAAADFVDHYEKATNCGYLSMYRKSDGTFSVSHEQDGLIPNRSNMTAAQLTEYESKLGCTDAAPVPLPEAKEDVIGYPDVATARKELLARKDAQAHTEGNGWLVVEIPSEMTLWSFSPESDPSYPAAVKRVVTQDASKNVYIEMNVLCEASKQACDTLVRQFNELNDRMKASLSH